MSLGEEWEPIAVRVQKSQEPSVIRPSVQQQVRFYITPEYNGQFE